MTSLVCGKICDDCKEDSIIEAHTPYTEKWTRYKYILISGICTNAECDVEWYSDSIRLGKDK